MPLKLALFFRMLSPYGFNSIFMAKKRYKKRLRPSHFPATLFRVLIICCRLTIRANKCIGIFSDFWVSLPLFVSLIYFGSLLKAAAVVILITIYLFISYLRNVVVCSHAPSSHCQTNFPLAAGMQSILLLFSLARAKFGEGVSRASGGIWMWKKGLNCALPAALGTLSPQARGRSSARTGWDPIVNAIGAAIGIDFGTCGPPERSKWQNGRINMPRAYNLCVCYCAWVCVCVRVYVSLRVCAMAKYSSHIEAQNSIPNCTVDSRLKDISIQSCRTLLQP